MRDSLLDCAVDHFGRFGFEGAATRAIAADCGTAMSSITYHFGSKEGLYLAAADHIATQMIEHHRPKLDAIRATPVSSPEEAIERLVSLLDGMAATMLGERSARWARFITREQQEPTEAFDRIYRAAMSPMGETIVHLIAIARPEMAPREQRATAFLMFGQVLALRAGRASLFRFLEIERLDADSEALLRRQLAVHVRLILSAPPETAR